MSEFRQEHSAESSEPLISVVMATLNQREFIVQALESIFAQDYEKYEVIVCDGRSSDGTVDIIKRYADRLAYWVSEKDTGQSNAINKGFRHAQGEIVAWLNSDDFYLPGSFHTVARAYRVNPGASFYFGNGLRVDRDEKELAPFVPCTVTWDREAMIRGVNYVLQPSTFINAETLRKVGYLDETLQYGMDTDLWIRLSQISDPYPLQETLAASREYEETKTSTGGFKRWDELRRIAEKYSKDELTPGVMCYGIHTFHEYFARSPKEFLEPGEIAMLFSILWNVMVQSLEALTGRPDGFPLPPEERQPVQYKDVVGVLRDTFYENFWYKIDRFREHFENDPALSAEQRAAKREIVMELERQFRKFQRDSPPQFDPKALLVDAYIRPLGRWVPEINHLLNELRAIKATKTWRLRCRLRKLLGLPL